MPRPRTDTIKFLSQDEAGRLFHELGEIGVWGATECAMES